MRTCINSLEKYINKSQSDNNAPILQKKEIKKQSKQQKMQQFFRINQSKKIQMSLERPKVQLKNKSGMI